MFTLFVRCTDVRVFSSSFWMNAALCVAQENHGSRQLGAEAAAAADVHLSVPPLRALPLLRRSRPHDSVRLPVRRGDVRLCFLRESSILCRVSVCPLWGSSPPRISWHLNANWLVNTNIRHLGYSFSIVTSLYLIRDISLMKSVLTWQSFRNKYFIEWTPWICWQLHKLMPYLRISFINLYAYEPKIQHFNCCGICICAWIVMFKWATLCPARVGVVLGCVGNLGDCNICESFFSLSPSRFLMSVISNTGGGRVEPWPVPCHVWLVQGQCWGEILPKQVRCWIEGWCSSNIFYFQCDKGLTSFGFAARNLFFHVLQVSSD